MASSPPLSLGFAVTTAPLFYTRLSFPTFPLPSLRFVFSTSPFEFAARHIPVSFPSSFDPVISSYIFSDPFFCTLFDYWYLRRNHRACEGIVRTCPLTVWRATGPLSLALFVCVPFLSCRLCPFPPALVVQPRLYVLGSVDSEPLSSHFVRRGFFLFFSPRQVKTRPNETTLCFSSRTLHALLGLMRPAGSDDAPLDPRRAFVRLSPFPEQGWGFCRSRGIFSLSPGDSLALQDFFLSHQVVPPPLPFGGVKAFLKHDKESAL